MDNIVPFQKIRMEKEIQLTTSIVGQVELIQNYVDRHVNIREKVKAKYIFSEKVGCRKSHVFSKIEEQLFLDWFTYDYITINGKTIYQVFAEHDNRMSHPLNSVIHALFMASVLEPFKVIKFEENHIHAEKLLTGEKCIIKTISQFKKFDSDTIFLRSIPVLDQLLCISGIFVQRDEELINNLINHVKISTDSWRTFLKKFAIKYC